MRGRGRASTRHLLRELGCVCGRRLVMGRCVSVRETSLGRPRLRPRGLCTLRFRTFILTSSGACRARGGSGTNSAEHSATAPHVPAPPSVAKRRVE